MNTLLFDIERFLRWLAGLQGNEKMRHSRDISEAASVFADELEPINDAADDVDDSDTDE